MKNNIKKTVLFAFFTIIIALLIILGLVFSRPVPPIIVTSNAQVESVSDLIGIKVNLNQLTKINKKVERITGQKNKYIINDIKWNKYKGIVKIETDDNKDIIRSDFECYPQEKSCKQVYNSLKEELYKQYDVTGDVDVWIIPMTDDYDRNEDPFTLVEQDKVTLQIFFGKQDADQNYSVLHVAKIGDNNYQFNLVNGFGQKVYTGEGFVLEEFDLTPQTSIPSSAEPTTDPSMEPSIQPTK